MLRHWLLDHGMTVSSYLGYPLGKSVRLLRGSQYWSAEEIKAYQQRALYALLHHCYSHVPYYRELMKSRKLHPSDFRSPSDLAKLPYLTRDIIRQQAAQL